MREEIDVFYFSVLKHT